MTYAPVLVLPQTPLLMAAHCAPAKGDKGPKADQLRNLYIRRVGDNGDTVEVCATDGHVALCVSFAYDPAAHTVSADYSTILPVGAYCTKAAKGATVSATPTESPRTFAVRVSTPDGAATETNVTRAANPADADPIHRVTSADFGSLLSIYERWQFRPDLLARICKAAGDSPIETLSTSPTGPCHFRWYATGTLKGSILTRYEAHAVLMPYKLPADNPDPHKLYAPKLLSP